MTWWSGGGHREDIYIRPLAFKGEERIANLKLQDLSDSLVIFPHNLRGLP